MKKNLITIQICQSCKKKNAPQDDLKSFNTKVLSKLTAARDDYDWAIKASAVAALAREVLNFFRSVN